MQLTMLTPQCIFGNINNINVHMKQMNTMSEFGQSLYPRPYYANKH